MSYAEKMIKKLTENIKKEVGWVTDTYKEYLSMYKFLILKGLLKEYYDWSAKEKEEENEVS